MRKGAYTTLICLAVGLGQGCDRSAQVDKEADELRNMLRVEVVKRRQNNQEIAELEAKLKGTLAELEAVRKGGEDRKPPPSPIPPKAPLPPRQPSGPIDSAPLLALANQLYDRGDYASARVLFEFVAQSQALDGKALFRRAKCVSETDEMANAIEAYRTTMAALRREDPKHGLLPRVLNNVGVLLRKEGKTEEAAEALGSAIEMAPDYATPYMNLGNLYADDQQDRPAAIRCFERYVQLDGPYAASAERRLAELRKAAP